MKRISPSNATTSLLVVGTVLVALAAGTAALASGEGARGSRSATEQVRAAEHTMLKALVDADTATAGRLLAPDFQLINVLGEPETRSDYLLTLGGGIDYVKLTPVSPIKVRLYGNAAVIRHEVAFVVTAGPDRLKHRGWITSVLERRHGRWQFVWSQTTPVPNDQALVIQALKAV